MGLKLLLAGAVLFASIAYVHMLQNRPHVLRGGEEVGHRGGIVVKKETQGKRRWMCYLKRFR
jgi:hypothetical protein